MSARGRYRFETVDVFTDRAFGGNPLAVFADARGLGTAAMQRIAREFNLSETTFVLPPDDAANDFRVRIFTPAAELPMAGHPTVGTAFVLARRGAVDVARPASELRFEEGVGLVRVAVECAGGAVVRATMQQPLPEFGPVFERRDALAGALGLDARQLAEAPVQTVSCGVPFLMVPLRDAAAVARARIDSACFGPLAAALPPTGLYCFATECSADDARAHARLFAPALGIAEDPATGGAAGPLAAYLLRHGLVARADAVAGFVVEQGIEMGRPSRIEVRLALGADDRVEGVFVGGASVAVTEGELVVPEGALR